MIDPSAATETRAESCYVMRQPHSRCVGASLYILGVSPVGVTVYYSGMAVIYGIGCTILTHMGANFRIAA